MNNQLEILDIRQTSATTCTVTIRVTHNYTTFVYEVPGVPYAYDEREKYIETNRAAIVEAAINANQAAYSERIAALELVTDMLMDEVV